MKKRRSGKGKRERRERKEEKEGKKEDGKKRTKERGKKVLKFYREEINVTNGTSESTENLGISFSLYIYLCHKKMIGS